MKMAKEKLYLILGSAVCILLAVLLAAGAISICEEGLIRQSEHPLESIYTVEIVAQKAEAIFPLFFFFFGLTVTGLVLGVKAAETELWSKGKGFVETKNAPEHQTFIRTVIVVAAVGFIIAGITNGSAYDVLVKAINICSECIGLG